MLQGIIQRDEQYLLDGITVTHNLQAGRSIQTDLALRVELTRLAASLFEKGGDINRFFGEAVYVMIVVSDDAATVTPTLTTTDDGDEEEDATATSEPTSTPQATETFTPTPIPTDTPIPIKAGSV